MKKFTILFTIMLISGVAVGQNLKKGNIVGMHVVEVDLKPDVTMDQYMDFYSSKVLLEYNNHMEGWNGYVVKGVRGENATKYGVIWIIKSEAARDRYFNDDGEMTEAGNASMERIQPLIDELDNYGTSSSTYTDWRVL